MFNRMVSLFRIGKQRSKEGDKFCSIEIDQCARVEQVENIDEVCLLNISGIT